MAVTMAWLRINRVVAVALLLCGALAAPCLATAARAEDDSAPTIDQCEAMPHETELETLEVIRCQMLYSIYQTAFESGAKKLELWKGDIKIQQINGSANSLNIIKKYAFDLSAGGGISMSVSGGDSIPNVFVIFMDENLDLSGSYIRTELDRFFSARTRDGVLRDLQKGKDGLHYRPFANDGGELKNCIIYVNTKNGYVEKKIGTSLALCSIGASPLSGYISIFSKSFFYSDVTWFDRQMLGIIYRWLRPGMTWAEAKPIINRVFDNNRQRVIGQGHQ